MPLRIGPNGNFFEPLKSGMPPSVEGVRVAPTSPSEETRSTEKVVGSFTDALRRLLEEVEERDAEAAELKRRLLTGEPVELHEILLAVEKAHLTFQTLLAVRTRLLEAYQELTRMPL